MTILEFLEKITCVPAKWEITHGRAISGGALGEAPLTVLVRHTIENLPEDSKKVELQKRLDANNLCTHEILGLSVEDYRKIWVAQGGFTERDPCLRLQLLIACDLF